MAKQRNPNPNQRHGRLGQVKLNPDGTVNEEAEKKRLYQNQKSREARARRKLLAKAQDDFVVVKPENVCDKWGITPKDEARYRRCCSSTIYNELSYVKMRTGLTLKQLSILQERTGLSPVPPVDKKKADIDYKRRYERGDIY